MDLFGSMAILFVHSSEELKTAASTWSWTVCSVYNFRDSISRYFTVYYATGYLQYNGTQRCIRLSWPLLS